MGEKRVNTPQRWKGHERKQKFDYQVRKVRKQKVLEINATIAAKGGPVSLGKAVWYFLGRGSLS